MRQFTSIEKLDTAILYILELASSLSVLLLAFGLIASMANVLTKGNVLTDNPAMQQLWAWTQCIAIDASVAGTIIRTVQSFKQREWVKASVYALLSALLLFAAAIVSNIEAIQQTLNITLDISVLGAEGARVGPPGRSQPGSGCGSRGSSQRRPGAPSGSSIANDPSPTVTPSWNIAQMPKCRSVRNGSRSKSSGLPKRQSG